MNFDLMYNKVNLIVISMHFTVLKQHKIILYIMYKEIMTMGIRDSPNDNFTSR